MARVKLVKGHRARTSSQDGLGHVRYRIQYSASCHLLQISSSRPTSENSGAWSTSTGMCRLRRLLLTAEASNSTTSRGVDCSLRGSEDLRVEFHVPSSLCDGVIVWVRVELGLYKDYKHISSQQLATSMPRRSPEHKKINVHSVPASRLPSVDQSGGAITWTCSWKRTVWSALLLRGVPASSRADVSCSSSPPMAKQTLCVDGDADERTSREPTKRGRRPGYPRRYDRFGGHRGWHGSSS